METIKSYTDIAQSRRLAEILPLESADMCYPLPCEDGDKPLLEQGGFGSTPCWSVAALLSVLPEGIIENYYAPNLQKENGKYSIAYGNDGLLCIADNPVDACYEMVLKLHKLNLL